MKTKTRILDYAAPNNGLDAKELPQTLFCIFRALLLAQVPGIRCINGLNGTQEFETAVGTPADTFMRHITEKARKGEDIPSPREALRMFGQCCHSPLPCGAPVSCDTAGAIPTPQKDKPAAQ
jgi:hypothetical protein